MGNQQCLVIDFKYQTNEKEVAQYVSLDEVEVPRQAVKTRFIVNPNGKLIEDMNIESHLSKVDPATLLQIDVTKNPAEIKLSNIAFLRNTKNAFKIFVFVTKNKRAYREGTIEFNGSKVIDNTNDFLIAQPNNITLHKVAAAN